MPKAKSDFTNFIDARPNYFPGQFLLEDDFEIEQKYFIDRQKYHRQSLHVSGIIEGLEVVVMKDKQEVVIRSGSGINSNGDLIILKKDTFFSQFTTLTVGELYISYREEKQVKQQEDFTRWQEVPTIGFAATTPNDGVKLAKISIVNNVPTLDLTVRSYSGIFLPNATGNDLTLRSGGNANPNVAILDGSLTVTGTITGKIDAVNINSGTLAVDRIPNLSANKITSGTISGNLSVTGALNADSLVLGPTNASHLRLGYHQDYSWIQSHGNKPLVINTSNNVGIGSTVNPIASLDISSASRTGTHPTAVKGLYITGDFNADSDGVEFRRSNGSQGIGFGFNTIYAAGSDANQGLSLKPKGTGEVTVSGNLKVTGSLTADNRIIAGGSDIYFTQTDHTHTNFGNTAGYAAIENCSTFGALMILGRAGTPQGRCVKLWDYLEVLGDLKVTGTITNESWQKPSLQNSWVHYENTYNPPGYFKDSFGIVHLRGLVKSGSSTIFTLPEGYRPPCRELHAVQTFDNTIGRIDILTNGEVCVLKGDNRWICLDGITFRVA
jgi:hypothetical protein